jgi:hypothetical protein
LQLALEVARGGLDVLGAALPVLLARPRLEFLPFGAAPILEIFEIFGPVGAILRGGGGAIRGIPAVLVSAHVAFPFSRPSIEALIARHAPVPASLDQCENDYGGDYKTHDSWPGRMSAVQRFGKDWRRPSCSLALMQVDWEQAGCHQAIAKTA